MTKKISDKETPQYKAGYDCGMNGSNGMNCNFKLFDTPEHTHLWEMGKREGELWRALKAFAGDIGFEILMVGSAKIVQGNLKNKYSFIIDFVGAKK